MAHADVQPLLNAYDGPPSGEAAYAEAGAPPLSVSALQWEAPDRALELLQAHGVETLGTLHVQDLALQRALGTDGDDLLTAAAPAPPGPAFDWERFWGGRLPPAPAPAPRGKPLRSGWTSNVAVMARVVAVEGAAAPGPGGLIALANARYVVTGDPSIFTLPAVEAVITYKWNAFARRALQAQLGLYFAWLLAFTLFTWLFQDEDLSLSLPELLATPRGAATVALQLAALAFMLPFLLQEARLARAYGLWRWAGIWNVLDSAAYVLQIAVTAVHLQRAHVASPAFSVVLAAQCLLLFAKIQYYSRVLQSANTSFVDTLTNVLQDPAVCYFLLFLVLSFYSFAAAFHILFRLDQKEVEEFNSFLHTTGTIFAFATGGPNFEVLWKSSVPLASSVLCFIYNFTLAIVLLNLLIALLSDSYGRVVERLEGRFRAAQASMIDELEVTLPGWLLPSAAAAPACVHFLQRCDDAGGDGGCAEAEEHAVGPQLKALVERMEALELLLHRIDAKLGA